MKSIIEVREPLEVVLKNLLRFTRGEGLIYAPEDIYREGNFEEGNSLIIGLVEPQNVPIVVGDELHYFRGIGTDEIRAVSPLGYSVAPSEQKQAEIMADYQDFFPARNISVRTVDLKPRVLTFPE